MLNNSFLLVENLSKSFGYPVLKDISLTIKSGESWVIIGPSGSGKSVLMRCILGLLSPDSGRIVLANADKKPIDQFSEYPEIFQTIGVVFQSSALFDSMSVIDNVMFRAKQIFSFPKAQKIAFEALSKVEFPIKAAHLYPSELSGGMKRKVSLARAIVLEPLYIFFDEPTTGLDPISSTAIGTVIRTCIKELNATALTITHDISNAYLIGDRIALLYEGKLRWSGSSDQLFEDTNPYIQQFIKGKTQGPIQTMGAQ